MATRCVSCDKGFGSNKAYSDHVRSEAHTLRQLANQLNLDKSIESRASISYRPSPSTQSQPGRQRKSVSQTCSIDRQHYCESCKKTFNTKNALNQHLQHSLAHIPAIAHPPQAKTIRVQNPLQGPSISGPSKVVPSTANNNTSERYPLRSRIHGRIAYSEQNSSLSLEDDSKNILLLEELARHCHPLKDLRKNKYVLSTYSDEDLAGLRKCILCGQLARNSRSSECYFHPGTKAQGYQNYFTCCLTSSKGCESVPHRYQEAKHAEKFKSFAFSPAVSQTERKSRAIVLDCEMAEVSGQRSEVILVCAVDYITGKVLLNQLVQPDEPVHDWRTKIHGITESMIKNAVSHGHAVSGWAAARAKLWQLVNQDTILIGHALEHDLDVLRMIHTRVVDSSILTRNKVGIQRVRWGLQKLCKELLELKIRDNKEGVHNGLEDVLATRKLVLWCIQNKADFGAWASVKRSELNQEAMRKKNKKKPRKPKVRPISDNEDDYETNDREILRWSDIAEDCGWPHPDTGYDPWSD